VKGQQLLAVKKKQLVTKCYTGPPNGTDSLERPMLPKMDMRKRECEGMAWTHLAQYGDQWRPLVNKAMNLRIL
jgi:hypothetical protein